MAKFCADLKDYAFEDTVKNLTTGEQGKALDATMGKALDEKIGNLNDLTTTSKDSVVDAVDELNMKLQKGTYTAADFNINTTSWIVQYFECIKSNGIVTINAALVCTGAIAANTDYIITTAPISNTLRPKYTVRITGNACYMNFGNTVPVNIFFDNIGNLHINSPSSENKYVAFTVTYNALA